MGILGLLQLIVMCIITFVCYKTFIPSGIDFVSLFLADVSINVKTISLLFVYFSHLKQDQLLTNLTKKQ